MDADEVVGVEDLAPRAAVRGHGRRRRRSTGPVTRPRAPRAKAMPLANATARARRRRRRRGGRSSGASTPTGSRRAGSASTGERAHPARPSTTPRCRTATSRPPWPGAPAAPVPQPGRRRGARRRRRRQGVGTGHVARTSIGGRRRSSPARQSAASSVSVAMQITTTSGLLAGHPGSDLGVRLSVRWVPAATALAHRRGRRGSPRSCRRSAPVTTCGRAVGTQAGERCRPRRCARPRWRTWGSPTAGRRRATTAAARAQHGQRHGRGDDREGTYPRPTRVEASAPVGVVHPGGRVNVQPPLPHAASCAGHC